MDDSNLSKEKEKGNFWKELGKLIILALVVVVPFRLYIAQPFIVDGASMEPTFHTGNYLIVDEITYRFREPERGSVLVFKYPKDPDKHFIKRVIGLPGELVSIQDGVVTITSNKYPSGLVLEEPYIEFEKKESLKYTLGRGEYFVMGDNRLASADSRIWGAVPKTNIIGRPILRFYPPAIFPGDMRNSYENTNASKQ